MPESPKKALILQYLGDNHARALVYHNHKEILAWGGVAFYFTLWPIISNAIEKHLGSKLLLIVMAIMVFLVTLRYVRTQLDLRHYMSDLTLTLPRLSACVMTMSEEEAANLKWTTLSPVKSISFIADNDFATNIEDAKDTKMTSDFVLPYFVFKEYQEVKKYNHLARRQLERLPLFLMSFGLLCFVGVIASSDLPLIIPVKSHTKVLSAPKEIDWHLVPSRPGIDFLSQDRTR